jgi:TatD DNase family protein
MIHSWIDTHCHLDAAEFAVDRLQQREAARNLGVRHCVIPAVQADDWKKVSELAHAFSDRYALGIHPLYTDSAQHVQIEQLRKTLLSQIDDPYLVAVGEIGLDGFVQQTDKIKQIDFFKQQLKLALEFDLPVILHLRKAVDPVLHELRKIRIRGGIAHAFNGSLQQAQQLIDMGFCIGFGGALTFDRSLQLRRLAQQLPINALVLETDAPDIPPQWIYVNAQMRSQGHPTVRNSPIHLPRIAQCLADLRQISLSDLADQTSANTKNALRWKETAA